MVLLTTTLNNNLKRQESLNKPEHKRRYQTFALVCPQLPVIIPPCPVFFKAHLGTSLNMFPNSSNLYKALNDDAGKLASVTNIADEGRSSVHQQAVSQI